MKADVHSNYSLVEVDCLDLSSNTGLLGVWQGSIAGTAVGGAPPANCSVNIRTLIVQHYRGGHPVLHHPPTTQSNQSGSRSWTGSFCTGVATHWQAMQTGITAITGHPTVNGCIQVVLLGYRPGAAPGAVVVSTPTGYLASTRIGTVRRRLTT